MSGIGDVKINAAKALQEISDYFAKPDNHRDKDTSHVSREEFQKAKADLSPDAGAVIDTILKDNDAYYNLRHQTWETLRVFNDDQVSTRDLRTAAAAPTTAARLQRQTELLKWREENRVFTGEVLEELAKIDTKTASTNFKHWLNGVQRHPEISAKDLADRFIGLAVASKGDPKKADSLFREWLNDPPPKAGLKPYTED